jgi:hypothetical protein
MKKREPKKPAVKQRLPRGWTEQKIVELREHYEKQTEEEQEAEHEAAYHAKDQTMMGVPIELVPEVRRLIASRRRA